MKRLIYMLIASTILFCNIDNVGAIKHTISSKNAAEDAKEEVVFILFLAIVVQKQNLLH